MLKKIIFLFIYVFYKDMPSENSETNPLLEDEEDGDKEEEPTHSVDVDVQVPLVVFLLTSAMPHQGERR